MEHRPETAEQARRKPHRMKRFFSSRRGPNAHEKGISALSANLDPSLVSEVLIKSISEEDGLVIWMTMANVLAQIVGASSVNVYVDNSSPASSRKGKILRLIADNPAAPPRFKLGRFVRRNDSDHIVASVMNRGIPAYRPAKGGTGCEAAFPIRTPIDGLADPLAVVVVEIKSPSDDDRARIEHLVDSLVSQVWPVCLTASIRLVTPHADELRLNTVITTVLNGLCGVWGFDFATISLVDEERQEIRTVDAKGEAREWIHKARHPLDVPMRELDIQARTVREGEVTVRRGWDPAFDATIYEEFGHEDLVRVFLPLGTRKPFGTIEAGFRIRDGRRTEIVQPLVDALTRYARFDVSPAIQRSLLHERAVVHLEALKYLHSNLRDLQGLAAELEEGAWLDRVVHIGQQLFGSGVDKEPLVLAHILNGRAASEGGPYQFRKPICAGKIREKSKAQPANNPDNIVQFVAREGAYFQSDVQTDPLLRGSVRGPVSGPRVLSFSQLQHVRSFAGLPLVAEGETPGVICVNYRHWRDFDSHFRQILEIFAQQIAAMLHSQRQVRQQERSMMSHDLHDAVKSHVMSISSFLSAAEQGMPPDADRLAKVRDCFKEIRHTTSGILMGVELIRHDYRQAAGGTAKSLRALLLEDLGRYSKESAAALRYDVDSTLPSFPLRLQMTIVWLLEQAVSNAIQHSGASSISAEVQCSNGVLVLEVEDDGVGFPVDSLRGRPHHGLAIMDERAREINGAVTIISSPEGRKVGTLVRVTVPLEG